MNRAALRRLGHHKLVEHNAPPAHPLSKRGRPARLILLVSCGGNQQIGLRLCAATVQRIKQRQRNSQTSLGVNCPAAVHPAPTNFAAERIGGHLLHPHCVCVNIQCHPLVCIARKNTIHTGARSHALVQVHLSAERFEPAGNRQRNLGFTSHSTARAGLHRSDARNLHKPAEPAAENFVCNQHAAQPGRSIQIMGKWRARSGNKTDQDTAIPMAAYAPARIFSIFPCITCASELDNAPISKSARHSPCAASIFTLPLDFSTV